MMTPRKLRAAWRNVTAGFTSGELWTQFQRETRTSLAGYSKETGLNVPEEWATRKRRAWIAGSVIRAMFYRLSPARRVPLLVAFVLMLLPQTVILGDPGWRITLPGSGLAALLLLVLLALDWPTGWA